MPSVTVDGAELYHEVRGTGHLAQLDEPRGLAQTIRSFLRGL